MRLTKREIELNKAREKGESDFDRNSYYPEQFLDIGLRSAYEQGWSRARADYNSFYSNYY